MTTKLRVIKMVLQPVVVLDDGETLTEIEVQPIVVPWKAWDAYVNGGLAEAMAQLEAQLAPPETEPPTP